jgi:hypothetical protein
MLPKNLGVYPPGAIWFINKQLGSAILDLLLHNLMDQLDPDAPVPYAQFHQ